MTTPTMISVSEVDRILAEHVCIRHTESCELRTAVDRVLREDIYPDRDLPPFDRVTMDGIALSSRGLAAGRREFRIEGTQAAGQPQRALADSEGGCLEAMTGAITPRGCDTVIPYEDIDVAGGRVTLKDAIHPKEQQYVHRKGSDLKQDQALLRAPRRLGATDIAAIASVGRADVLVSSLPSIAIVSNGDELVELGQPVESHQIRPSNTYAMLAGLLQRRFANSSPYHLPDDEDAMTEAMRSILAKHDVVVLSGGVSRGKYDLVPKVLAALGVNTLFHRVAQRPGKPLWFGQRASGQPVFALPGNPASTLVCFYRYVVPYLSRMLGLPDQPQYATLAEDVTFTPPLTYFMPVKRQDTADGTCHVQPVAYRGSGDYVGMANSDGFVELDRDQNTFPKGTVARYYSWR